MRHHLLIYFVHFISCQPFAKVKFLWHSQTSQQDYRSCANKAYHCALLWS